MCYIINLTMKTLSKIAILTLSSSSLLLAQAGDNHKRDGKQKDPIPADQIPPSPYLSLNDALKSFTVAPGFTIEPVAVGEFVHKAIAMKFDSDGRIWTVEMRNYMTDVSGSEESKPGGRIRILEDTNGDGKIDTATTFLDNLHLPRAIALTEDGCLYTSGETLYYIKRDGLKPSGEPIIVDKTYARGGNPEHAPNGLLYGNDNWLYSAKHNKRYRRIDGQWIIQDTNSRGQWSIAKDNAGRLFHNNNSTFLIGDQFTPNFYRGNPTYTPKARLSYNIPVNRTYPLHMTPGVNRGYQSGLLDKDGKLKNPTAASGVTIYRGDNFPEEYKNTAFTCEPVADLIKAIDLSRNANNRPSGKETFQGKEFIASTDEWFAPVSISTAPDGTLYFVDMVFGLIQHKTYMTTYLRKQYESRNLDKPSEPTGRIYRVRYEKKKASPVIKLSNKSSADLIPFLSHPNGHYRDTAQRILVERNDKTITSTLNSESQLAATQTPVTVIHSLWTTEGLGASSPAALAIALKHSDTDVKNTALEIAALNHFEDPALTAAINANCNGEQTIHAKIKALAACGASDEALKLTLENRKTSGTDAAFISGLGKHVHQFKPTELNDKKLLDLLHQAKAKTKKKIDPKAHLTKEQIVIFDRGEKLYFGAAACAGCHGNEGEGTENMAPPLVDSEWVTGDPTIITKILLHGAQGPIKVKGKLYKAPAIMPVMPGYVQRTDIKDNDISDLINYVRNNWGNKAPFTTEAAIKKVRQETKDQEGPYTPEQLKK